MFLGNTNIRGSSEIKAAKQYNTAMQSVRIILYDAPAFRKVKLMYPAKRERFPDSYQTPFTYQTPFAIKLVLAINKNAIRYEPLCTYAFISQCHDVYILFLNKISFVNGIRFLIKIYFFNTSFIC